METALLGMCGVYRNMGTRQDGVPNTSLLLMMLTIVHKRSKERANALRVY